MIGTGVVVWPGGEWGWVPGNLESGFAPLVAVAVAKSLQSCPTLCDPIDRSPPDFPVPPGKNTEVGCHFLLQCMKVKSESEVAQSCPTLATPWTAAHQAPPSMDFLGKSTGVGSHCTSGRWGQVLKLVQAHRWLCPGLVPFAWWLRPGSRAGDGPLTGEGHILGLLVDCASCFACGIPGLVPTGWCAGLVSGTNTLEGGFQSGVYQHQCPHGRINFCQCLCACVPRVDFNCLLALQNAP